jgi:hypothetical protein
VERSVDIQKLPEFCHKTGQESPLSDIEACAPREQKGNYRYGQRHAG